ncbi:MAG TPA: DNA polymerase III subunit gamma/tau [Solirubrobacteraceae bacterium]|nr:DNA polymerase III subunit gamma/tau [Solirubrobacteraceae bacterium]
MPPAEHPEQPQSLYRRHRPRTFAEVVGQEAVVKTLRNAVQRGNVHHAYLFVGSRGTGKTSVAKILAACLNCERGPTVEPCGVCDSCRSIANASSLDVIEMDAASNNSVDDIRELRESVAYAPVSGRRKVYILDEAHMLSTAAWNAFLKTLEEPPPNTTFVLATTEARKVPATVIDRCHRFDFHRPSIEQIATVVRRTAQAESIEIPAQAVAAVARSAAGSFRDALGTLEQLVTFSGREIELDDVLSVLGVADSELLARTVDAVAGEDARGALLSLGEFLEQGRDAAAFARDLESRARELLVVQTLGEVPAELSLTADADDALAQQAARVPTPVVVRLLEELGIALEAMSAGAEERTRLELALVKAAKPSVDHSTRALLERIERLEAGRPPVSAVASSDPPADATAPAQAPPPASAAAPAPVGAGAPGPAPTPARAPVAAAQEDPPAALSESQADPPAALSEPRDEAAARAREGARDLESVRALWPAVIDLVRGANAMLAALIEQARPVALDGEELTVAFPSSASFLKKKAESGANRATVASALGDLAGGRWRLSYELREELDVREDESGAPRSEQEWVARFMEEFDAEELPPDPPDSAEVGVSEGQGV